MLTLEEKHKMQSKEVHSILWLNYSTWSSASWKSPTICWKAMKSTSPNRFLFLPYLLWGCERMGTGITIPKKQTKTQRRANLILVDWKVPPKLLKSPHLLLRKHWEDKIWGSVWMRIPPLKNNPAMNMKWRNIYVYIYMSCFGQPN